MRGALYPDDHAFAEGLVYPKVASLSEAAGHIPDNEADAQRLLDVWTRFSKGAALDDNVKLGIKARLINGGAPEIVSREPTRGLAVVALGDPGVAR